MEASAGVELELVVTGASGSSLAVRFAEQAAEHSQLSTPHEVLSDGARLVVSDELGKHRATPRGFVTGLAVNETARRETHSRVEADLAALMFTLYLLDMMVRA